MGAFFSLVAVSSLVFWQLWAVVEPGISNQVEARLLDQAGPVV